MFDEIQPWKQLTGILFDTYLACQIQSWKNVVLNSNSNINCKRVLPAFTLCDGAKSNYFTKHRRFLVMVKCYNFSAFHKNGS